MKTVKVVSDLVDKALKNTDKEYKVNRRGEEIYRAKCSEGFLHLWHYGTLILSANLKHKTVEHVGGWSNSDRDAINNALYMADISLAVRRKGEDIILC